MISKLSTWQISTTSSTCTFPNLKSLYAKFKETNQADQCDLDNFKNFASWTYEAGPITGFGNCQIASRTDGMIALRDFLLEQRQFTREGVTKKCEARVLTLRL